MFLLGGNRRVGGRLIKSTLGNGRIYPKEKNTDGGFVAQQQAVKK